MNIRYLALCPLLFSGCTTVNNYPGAAISGSANQGSPSQQTAWQYQRAVLAYRNKVTVLVARANRDIRVAKEQAEISRFGHPVPLPVGVCDATITINGQGAIERIRTFGCSSKAMAEVERQAIRYAAPFGSPPSGVHTVEIENWDPDATPGAYDPEVSAYRRRVAVRVAHAVRRIGSEEEGTGIHGDGHFVPLPVGPCHAFITVSAHGLVRHIRSFACASAALADVERRAIRLAAPFGTPPTGVHRVGITTLVRKTAPPIQPNRPRDGTQATLGV